MANWGFLGAGSIAASSLAPAVHAAPGARLHAVAARDEARAAALAPRRTYTAYPDLLADPEVDIVYVALHNSAHRPWVEAALAAGKHVLCEKPLGLTETETAAMEQAARRAERTLVEAAWNRWHPRTRDAEAAIAGSAIGRPLHVTAAFHGLAPAPDNYRRVPALGGGALYDVGYYALSAALAAFSWRMPRVEHARWESWDASSADRSVVADLAFPCGGTAEIRCSLDSELAEEFAVHGTEGSLRLSEPAFTAGAAPCTLATTSEHVRRTADVREYAPTDPYRLMVTDVDRALSVGTGYLVPTEQSRLIARLIDAVRAAASRADGGAEHTPAPHFDRERDQGLPG
ncbi:Gfo/Idh/MocA family protein [Streptomyces kanamyceticus]|uniref:Gfo/Idh/MocA family oxidoreductase n=1 Tax=Streptomyces kanamyceticus TaxID=1967 RepID=A0A5J6GQZ5_STRKN|nr:Gfo/Idh/MocA family oxidoreductase [Streptomyces kanamyceticus]QEU96198.1 gfo/Idh/MocA family oxidoreductase [Streptomyces kanamyceticus]